MKRLNERAIRRGYVPFGSEELDEERVEKIVNELTPSLDWQSMPLPNFKQYYKTEFHSGFVYMFFEGNTYKLFTKETDARGEELDEVQSMWIGTGTDEFEADYRQFVSDLLNEYDGIDSKTKKPCPKKEDGPSKSEEHLKESLVGDHPAVMGAYNYAKTKHDATGAKRKNSGLPYFVHPEMVAETVAAYGGTDEEIEAALLHDTLEDTDATAEELESIYGTEVAQIVEEITNFRPEVDRLGKEQYINKELLELSDSALLVKLADMLCNSLDQPKPGQAERMARNLQYLLDFGDDLDPRCRRLIKSFPLMDGREDLDKSEFDASIDDDDFEETESMYLIASRKRNGKRISEQKLEEGNKLKAAILAGVLALGGMSSASAWGKAKKVEPAKLDQAIEKAVEKLPPSIVIADEDFNLTEEGEALRDAAAKAGYQNDFGTAGLNELCNYLADNDCVMLIGDRPFASTGNLGISQKAQMLAAFRCGV